jgi:hypothetical protein
MNHYQLLTLARKVILTLPTTLSDNWPFDCRAPSLDTFQLRFEHNRVEHWDRILTYIYLNHAYEVTNNPDLKPLVDYFTPNSTSIADMMFHVNNAKRVNYFPTHILEPHGFASLDELVQEIENALNGTGLPRIANIRSYINEAKSISTIFLSAFTEEDYEYGYDELAPDNYKIRSVYRPLLFLLDIIQKPIILNRFKEMFYALKYKQQFRHLLWTKVREPKIRAKYHPDNLAKMLEGRDEIDMEHELDIEQLDALMDQW